MRKPPDRAYLFWLCMVYAFVYAMVKPRKRSVKYETGRAKPDRAPDEHESPS